MINKPVLPLLLFLLSALGLGAQSNDLIDGILDEETASFGKAVTLALLAGDLIAEDVGVERAVQELDGREWNVRGKGPEDPMTFGEYSYLLMRIFEMQGGVMYRILPGPRYAARELAFLRIIRTNAEPGRTVSGGEAVRILSALLEWKEANP